MPRFWINPTLDRARGGALVALCDRCAAEPETARAVREQGWKEVSRSHPRAREGAWYCQTCGELLEDVPPVRVLRRP
jgi:hypothetical protein